MKKFTKFCLLFLSLTVLSLVSSATSDIAVSASTNFSSAITGGSPFSFFTTTINEFTLLRNPLSIEDTYGSNTNVHGRVKLLHYKKKYKRIVSSYPDLKTPVKYLDIVPRSKNAKPTYSKPHFLSQLHHFLFRLTPF